MYISFRPLPLRISLHEIYIYFYRGSTLAADISNGKDGNKTQK